MIQLDTVVVSHDALGNEVRTTIKDPADFGHRVEVGDYVSDGASVGLVVSVAEDRPRVSWLPDSHLAYIPLKPFGATAARFGNLEPAPVAEAVAAAPASAVQVVPAAPAVDPAIAALTAVVGQLVDRLTPAPEAPLTARVITTPDVPVAVDPAPATNVVVAEPVPAAPADVVDPTAAAVSALNDAVSQA